MAATSGRDRCGVRWGCGRTPGRLAQTPDQGEACHADHGDAGFGGADSEHDGGPDGPGVDGGVEEDRGQDPEWLFAGDAADDEDGAGDVEGDGGEALGACEGGAV